MKTWSPVRSFLCGVLLAVRLHAASDVTVSTGSTSGGAFSGGSPPVFTPTAAAAVANQTTIQTSLSGGTSVTVNTASAIAKSASTASTTHVECRRHPHDQCHPHREHRPDGDWQPSLRELT